MSTDDMTFNQFLDWATGFTLIKLGSGDSLRNIIHSIICCLLNNKVFGGQSNVPNN